MFSALPFEMSLMQFHPKQLYLLQEELIGWKFEQWNSRIAVSKMTTKL
jgi:hypothetical protein